MRGRSALLLVVVLVTAGCGTTAAPGAGSPQPGSSRPSSAQNATTMAGGSREALLATCPALAPSWFHGQTFPPGVAGQVQQRRQLGLRSDPGWVAQLQRQAAAGSSGANSSYGPVLSEQEQRVMGRRQQAVTRAEEVAVRFLRRLPPSQRGEVRVGDDRQSVVVQVTRDGAHAQAALQAEVGKEVTVRVEIVRYPAAELQRLAQRIQRLPQLHWSAIGAGTGNDRVEVQVADHVERARRLIGTIASSCEFTVSQGSLSGGGKAGTVQPTTGP